MSATGFSYAQAARGQTAPQVTASIPSSTAALEAKESTSSSSTPLPTATSVSVLTNGAAKTASESGSASRKLDSDAGSATDSVTLIGTLVESTSNISLDDATFQAAASDKSGRASTSTGATRSSSADDSARRTRKPSKAAKATGKEDTAASVESDKEKEPVKAVLAPAPMPTKNIWEERRRELAIKAKFTTAIKARPDVPATATAAAGTPVKAKDVKKPASVPAGQEASTNAETNGFSSAAKPQPRRLSETTRPDQARRNGPRGNRTTDKDAKATASRSTLPPVQDTTLWPTPDSAAVTTTPESRLRTTSEAVDKADASDKDVPEDSASSKPRKKGNWITLDYEPAQSFRPPPPGALRGSKPKTGGRGGRDSASRGGFNGVTNGSASADRTSSATTSSADRSKEANGSAVPARSGPQANPSKDAANGREARQPSGAADADRANESASDYSAGKGDFAKGHHHSNTNGDVNGHHASHAAQSDRRYSSTRGDHHHHASRDAGAQAREHQGLNGREVRGDRPGRGGFRGRGGHGASASQGHHIPRSSYQANGQRAAGNGTTFGSNGTSTLPPSATPFSPSAQQFPFANTNNATRSGRATGRAQSVSQPPTYTNSRAQNGAANGARAHPHGLHMPAEFQMQQPYAVSPYSVMEGDHFLVLSKQVEYYFSVENLCKDMFLRKKMDGLGFVPLSVVAGFRRMAELAPSIEFIRAACEQSEKLDYLVDKDHNELIRSRHEWRKFVLPLEQRNEEARNGGPELQTSIYRSLHSRPPHVYFPSIFTPGFQGAAPGMFPGPVFAVNGNDPAFHGHDGVLADQVPAVNGSAQVNGKPRGGESQLSAAVPDFSPTSAGAPMTLEDYQNCPDEQVEKLVVVVASDADAGASEAASSGPSQSAGPNGSHSSSGDKPSGINGVSHSETTQEAPAQGSTDVVAVATMAAVAATAVGVLPPVFIAGKKVEEPYPELRARALEQRQHVKSGETPAGMKHLYRFWSHCLPDKFNVRMYEDFRSLALDDARNTPSNDFGLRQLVRYYNHVLIDPTGTRPYPSVFLPHFTEAKELLDAGKKAAASDETQA